MVTVQCVVDVHCVVNVRCLVSGRNTLGKIVITGLKNRLFGPILAMCKKRKASVPLISRDIITSHAQATHQLSHVQYTPFLQDGSLGINSHWVNDHCPSPTMDYHVRE